MIRVVGWAEKAERVLVVSLFLGGAKILKFLPAWIALLNGEA